MQKIKLSDHFTYKKLLRFTLPSMLTLILISLYTVVDGLFVSNFVGKVEFAALNLIFPFIMVLGGVGFMFGTGGSALVAMTLGQKEKKRAHQYFTMIILALLLLGSVLAGLSLWYLPTIAKLLGASGEMLSYAVLYGGILLAFNPIFMLQNVFQSFLVVAEKAKIGLLASILAGLMNLILDVVFILFFKWGLAGAALATGIGYVVGALIPLIYLLWQKNDLLQFTKTKLELKPIFKAMTNGLSEFVSTASGSIISMVFNLKLIYYAGENGVAAYGIVMYVQFIFISIFIGYTLGSAPLISYHFGAQNIVELKNLFKKSVSLMLVFGLVMTRLALLLKVVLARLFVGYDEILMAMTVHAFSICAFAFLLQGLNLFASSLFTALNDGMVSALLSLCRAFVFELICVLILPFFFEINGIWLSIVLAEVFSALMASYFILKKRGYYQYL